MNFEKYKGTLPYCLSDAEKKAMLATFKQTEDNFVGTMEQHTQLKQHHKDVLSNAEDKMRTNYGAEQVWLDSLFWQDSFEELGIPLDHPKADKMQAYAWSKGHSCGYSEVFSELCDIWEVVQ